MTIDLLQFKPEFAVSTLEDDSDYQSFLTGDGQGLCFVPEPYGNNTQLSLASDSGDFAKWIRQHDPLIPISLPTNTPKVVLRNADVWLPLIYLASDTSVQVFLNMAASYLYDKAKGALKNENPRIHMRAIYQDKRGGKTKKFEFSGDAEALTKVIKKFDPNNFFDESP